MKGRRKIPDTLKTLRGTDQPCRMTDGAKPPATNVVAVPRSGLKGTARKGFGIVANLYTNGFWMSWAWIWSWPTPARWGSTTT